MPYPFSGWYRATQAMECLGLISIVLALLTILLYVCVPSCKVKRALYLMIIFTFAAGNIIKHDNGCLHVYMIMKQN